MPRCCALLLPFALALGACRAAPAAPAEQRLNLVVYGDSVIYSTDMQPSEPLQVAVLRADTRAPVPDVAVEWRVVAGSGVVGQPRSTSNGGGVAASWLHGAPLGSYRVEATAEKMVGGAPVLEVRVVARPEVHAVQPASITAGGEVTITGTNFGPDHAVYFDDVRGRILAANPTMLRVQVPGCLPSRQAAVRVALGAVTSAPLPLAVAGTGGAVVSLQPGGVTSLTAAAELECIRIPAAEPGTAWVLVVHNAAGSAAPPARFELRGFSAQAAASTATDALPAPMPAFAASWEAALRRSERALGPAAVATEGDPATRGQALAAEPPAVGSRRDFNVFSGSQRFSRVTATARRVSQHAVLYVDVDANGEVSDADLQYFAATFDDPVYPSMVEVFGAPSDVDGNQRVIILFTPRVNELTPRGSASFVTGFFYGCDLVSRTRCSGSNQGEIFYALVPDPTGRWGDLRSSLTVRAAVPPVLAHEFQHMIHFARRGFSNDALWLSEGLAHMAEDLMAGVLAARGETALAATFRAGNNSRAQQFLANPHQAGLLDEETPGTIAQRGAAWLFVKYARLHYGGDDLLRRITASTRSSVANVVHETGQEWGRLAVDFGVALWASDSPEVAGPLEPRYTFPGFSLRAAVSPIPGTFPLRAPAQPWGNLAVAGSVAPAGGAYFSLLAPAGSPMPALNLILTGPRGAPLPAGTDMVLSLVRVR